jgi:hypothetical protein
LDDLVDFDVLFLLSANVVTTIVGNGVSGRADGVGTSVAMTGPTSLALDTSGDLITVDSSNNLIRRVTTAG